MKIRWKLLVAGLFIFSTTILSQATFSKTFSFFPSFGDVGRGILESPNGYYIVTSSVDNTGAYFRSFAGLLEITREGELISVNHYNSSDGYFETGFVENIIEFNNELLLVGTLETNKLGKFHDAILRINIERYENKIDTLPASDPQRLTQEITINRFQNDSFQIVSADLDSISYYQPVFHRATQKYRQVELVNPFPEKGRFVLGDVEVDAFGNTYLTHSSCFEDYVCRRVTRITKVSRSGQFVWTKDYGGSVRPGAPRPKLSLVNEGKMILAWTRDTIAVRNTFTPPVFYLLDSLGIKEDSLSLYKGFRGLLDMQPTSDGGIIACGTAKTEFGQMGWIIRLDHQLNIVWERFLKDERAFTNSTNLLVKVMEDSHGDIISTGHTITDRTPTESGINIWLVKLSEGGCISSNCADTLRLTTNVSPIEVETSAIDFYPNPVSDILVIKFPITIHGVKYSLFDVSGTLIKRGNLESNSIDLRNVRAGAYVLKLSTKKGEQFVQRIIKY